MSDIASLGDVRGKRVLVRSDLNVPLKDGQITDDGRVRASVPTIKALTEAGARVIVCAHLGRPSGTGFEEKYSLAPAAARLGELLGQPVALAGDTVGESAQAAVESMADGDVVMLENLRFNAGETAKVDADLYSIAMVVPLGEVAAGGRKTLQSTLFAGPQQENQLAELAPGLELVKDYGWFTILAKPLFWLLTQLHGVLGNWGWSIVALVVLLKVAFYWLNASAYRSMAKMKAVAPRMTELRERYKDKPQQLQQVAEDEVADGEGVRVRRVDDLDAAGAVVTRVGLRLRGGECGIPPGTCRSAYVRPYAGRHAGSGNQGGRHGLHGRRGRLCGTYPVGK